MQTKPSFLSTHFDLQQLSEGVYAAIARNGGSAICNAGLVDLGGQVLVFDAFLTPQAALDLRQASVELFGQAPNIVVNSHYHNDHIWGNQVFLPESIIISSGRTRQLIATAGNEELQWYLANATQRLESLRDQVQNTKDQREQDGLRIWIGEYQGAVEALPGLKLCLPGLTFDQRLEIHGAQRTVKLVAFENGHTANDTILYLPQDGLIFMSDLLFVGFHPYLADGDPVSLLVTLGECCQLGASRYVPGHGPVGDMDDVKLMMAYIEGCLETARKLVENNTASEAVIKGLPVPETCQNWLISEFYATNINFMCRR